MARFLIMEYTKINAETIDKWIEEGWEWGIPISHEAFLEAKKGNWEVGLTPTKAVPKEWFGDLKGKKILGLASGGAQQMPVFAAAGAKCTVLDYSERQLLSEKEVAEREGYEIEIVHADMTKTLPFPEESFDIVFHPVSNCYVKDVDHVFREAYRVLKKGGRLLSGLDNGLSYAFDDAQEKIVRRLPFDPLANEADMRESLETDSGVQFSHDVSEQIGGQLRAGFILKDIFGDTDAAGNFHDHNIECYFATLALK